VADHPVSVEDEEDEDEENEDDSNDPEWRIDDDRDSETGKKEIEGFGRRKRNAGRRLEWRKWRRWRQKRQRQVAAAREKRSKVQG